MATSLAQSQEVIGNPIRMRLEKQLEVSEKKHLLPKKGERKLLREDNPITVL